MERLTPRPDFQEENRQARNAEEALLAVLNACARVTKIVSKIQWHTPEAFGTWISRLQGQRINTYADVFCLNCLSFLDLQGCTLILKDFFQAHLEGANLEGAYLKGAYLEGAYLKWANLERAYLEGANLERAHLEGAYLEGAYLEGANLEGANLEGAYLEWPKLLPTNFGSEDLADSEQNSDSGSNELPASE